MTWVSKESVDDTSFLGEAARRLCVNTPVYWSHSYGVNTLPEGMSCRKILLLHVFVLKSAPFVSGEKTRMGVWRHVILFEFVQ